MLTGAAHDTVMDPSPGFTVGAPGVSGLASTRTLVLLDGSDSPTSFVAVTEKVCSVPFVRPSKRHSATAPQDLESPCVWSVTVKEVMGEPPVVPVRHDTRAVPALLETALAPVGAPGLSRTVAVIVPWTSRSTSLVASCTR